MTRAPGAAFDVIAVGGGIAGLAAALAAAEEGGAVALVEKAPPAERGGNTRFADAQIRFPHRADEFGARDYSPEEFRDDLLLPLIEPPFVAVPVTGGITSTFGGLKVDASARVIDTAGRVIDGLYAAGETIGELYYYNYPGATSVLRGAVFGGIAGRDAARRARAR